MCFGISYFGSTNLADVVVIYTWIVLLITNISNFTSMYPFSQSSHNLGNIYLEGDPLTLRINVVYSSVKEIPFLLLGMLVVRYRMKTSRETYVRFKTNLEGFPNH